MPNAAREVLIVHGWSDSYVSFQPLKSLLVAAGYQTTQVFLGQYASMRDDVTFDDLATGLQRRFVEMGKNGALTLDPFSLDIIVHSTGGPVVRHWLNHYLGDICKSDLARCPVRSLIMLAPANFGSRLAAGIDASPQAARAVLDATAGLTRVVSVAISLFMALVVVSQVLRPGTGPGVTLGLGMAILLCAIAWSVWCLKSVHGRLGQSGQLGGLNFAHGRSWLILAAILVVPLPGVAFALVSVLCR